MKVYVDGRGVVRLGQKDFVSQGGEGAVYAKGDTAYKLYTDPARAMTVGKLKELQTMTDPRVIRPERLVTDGNGDVLGYTMRTQDGGRPLCQLFTRAFRERNGVTAADAFGLVRQMQAVLSHVHSCGNLVVDLNEMNLLVGPSLSEVYFLDVDSWQTPHYPATAIMDSIRDRHAGPGGFTRRTDWFAFAIVSFQLLVGIHPYKGTHPRVKGLDARMQANLSVFHPSVRMPKVCYPLSVLPGEWRDWYEGTFERGERRPPPSAAGPVVPFLPQIQSVRGAGILDTKELWAFAGTIRGVWSRHGVVAVATNEGVYVDGRRVHGAPAADFTIGFTPGRGTPVLAEASEGGLRLTRLDDGSPIPFALRGSSLMGVEGRIIGLVGDRVFEVVLKAVGTNVVASPRVLANVVARASALYDGVAVQNLLGATWVSLFGRGRAARQVRLEQLDGSKVVGARYQRGVLMVLAVRAGRYNRWVFRVADGAAHDVRCIEDVGPSAMEFVTLETGVCVCLTGTETLELSSNRPGTPDVKVIEDPLLGGDMQLFEVAGQLAYARGRQLRRMTMTASEKRA